LLVRLFNYIVSTAEMREKGDGKLWICKDLEGVFRGENAIPIFACRDWTGVNIAEL
jgi:hypothetical protein